MLEEAEFGVKEGPEGFKIVAKGRYASRHFAEIDLPDLADAAPLLVAETVTCAVNALMNLERERLGMVA